MAFAQFTYRESLRDLEACLRAQRSKLYHLGIRSVIARNTLANVNAVRDWRIYADYAQSLMGINSEALPERTVWRRFGQTPFTHWMRPPSICACRYFRGAPVLRKYWQGFKLFTPVDVVHGLRAAGLAAMVSTQVKPFPTIPRMTLLTELEKHCNLAVRSDWIDVPGEPAGITPKPKFPDGFKVGDVWIDYEF